MRPLGLLPALITVFIAACDKPDAAPQSTPQSETEVVAGADGPVEAPDNPTVDEMLPAEMLDLWVPWRGDFDGMVERRVVRALTTYGGYQFYYHNGRPRGAIIEMLAEFENYLNAELGRRNIRVYVLPVPVSREQLIPNLIAGHGDMIATDLTITPARELQIAFSRDVIDDVAEVVVTGPTAPPLNTLDDLSGKDVFIRMSSSYREHLESLSRGFEALQREPVNLVAADELLEAEDIAEMLSHGDIGISVIDDYKADFWATVMPDIAVRHDLPITTGQSIAWATRKESPQLLEHVNAFLRKSGRGSLFGNDTYNRHLADARRERCANSSIDSDYVDLLTRLFRQYGDQYNFDWLKLAAQAYQESGLRQNRESSAGAVGIMQIKPSTAADRSVGINDVSTIENNIHAGAKYMRFIADRYFPASEFGELNQWLFTLAAYNAGPSRVNRFRREAAQQGLDPTEWFDNVEIIAGRRIGRETVTYVSNIFKYFVNYRLTWERGQVRDDRFQDVLVACGDEP